MEKILIITYYWPPSGGSGVQRWLYFAKYLPLFGLQPVVITVDEKASSYKFLDHSLEKHASETEVYRTWTREPLKIYSKLTSGSASEGIPQGFAGEDKPGFFKKLSRFVRGNFFIPDARKGWVPFARKQAEHLIKKYNIKLIVTTGPPHSTHLAGLALKRKFRVKWLADFRDPWTEIYYNSDLYRTRLAVSTDKSMELNTLRNADMVTTVGPTLRDLLVAKIPDMAPKIKVVYNGFDQELFDSIPRKQDLKFIISHIGLLGPRQPVGAFLEALNIILDKHKAHQEIRFQIVGKTSEGVISEIKNSIPKIELKLVEYIPHREALVYMKGSNLLLNSLPVTANSKLIVSGKLMEYVASGTPVLALGDTDGDAAGLLSELDHAAVFQRNDINGIASFIESVFLAWKSGKPAERKLTDIAGYSRRSLTGEMAGIIKEMLMDKT